MSSRNLPTPTTIKSPSALTSPRATCRTNAKRKDTHGKLPKALTAQQLSARFIPWKKAFNAIIVHVSKFFKLQVGDFIYTGTPAGVGPVQVGDKLEGFLMLEQRFEHVLTCDIR